MAQVVALEIFLSSEISNLAEVVLRTTCVEEHGGVLMTAAVFTRIALEIPALLKQMKLLKAT